MSGQIEEDILRALRRIARAVDLHSRELVSRYGLTGPQLVCLRTIERLGETTPTAVAREVALSQATVTGIIDRLAARQLIKRERSERDRRQVQISVTDAGEALIEQAPSPLQTQFVQALSALSQEDQLGVLGALEQIVGMMGGDEIDAAPVLAPGLDVEAPLGPDKGVQGGRPIPGQRDPTDQPDAAPR